MHAIQFWGSILGNGDSAAFSWAERITKCGNEFWSVELNGNQIAIQLATCAVI